MNAPADLSKVWYTRCQVPTASGLALGLGWLSRRFEAEGVAFGILQDAPIEIALSHYDHSLPGLIREGGNVPAIVARAEGAPTRLVGLTFIDEGQAIVAHPERLASAADMRGHRVAIPGFARTRNASHARAMALGGFEAALAFLDLDLGDVGIVETPLAATIPPGSLREAAGIKDWPSLHQVASGEADAAYVKGAAGREAAEALGLRVIVDIDALPIDARVNNGTPRPITVHAALIQSRPELVVDFLALTLAAAAWAPTHRVEAAALVARETGASLSGAEAFYGTAGQDGFVPSLADERRRLLSIQVDRLASHGFIDGPVDIDVWSEPAILQAAQARASALTQGTNPWKRV